MKYASYAELMVEKNQQAREDAQAVDSIDRLLIAANCEKAPHNPCKKPDDQSPTRLINRNQAIILAAKSANRVIAGIHDKAVKKSMKPMVEQLNKMARLAVR